MINHPRLLCVLCLVLMWTLALVGAWLRGRTNVVDSDDKSLAVVVSATLTLLGLMIGFTFSMAASRYDQRKLYEEGEANAIGTEYVRADLMPPEEAAAAKALLLQYLDRRVAFYRVGDYGTRLEGVDAETTMLQGRLWDAVKPIAAAQPTPVTALVVSGMNDVLNAQGYTQFAWWNRIPTTAWTLLILIACFANLLVGYATKRSRNGTLLLLVLPVLVSVSFFLVSDIDSPRGGVIRVAPRDLLALQSTLNQQRHTP